MTARPRICVPCHAALAVVIAGVLVAVVSVTSLADAWSRDAPERAQTAAATPVAATAEPEDPLDGDPLDGKLPARDAGAPDELTQFVIARSGRPTGSPVSLPAYDGDPETSWSPEEKEQKPWLWFDLGEERRLREVRWLAEGDGQITVAISNDRRRWEEVDSLDVSEGWQGIELRDDARFVRLTLVAADERQAPSIAEVAVYGRDGGGDVSLEQKAGEGGKDKKKDDEAKDKNSDQKKDDKSGGSGKNGGGGQTNVQAEAGDTRCKGDKGRCRAREGRVVMEEDCEVEGSCKIDVQVDGGTAMCDATGGDETRAGRGRGKEGGEGGRCEATADGGTVTIGDINP